jgi:hypothetical protein
VHSKSALERSTAHTAHMFNWIIRYLETNVKYITDFFLDIFCLISIFFTVLAGLLAMFVPYITRHGRGCFIAVQKFYFLMEGTGTASVLMPDGRRQSLCRFASFTGCAAGSLHCRFPRAHIIAL